MLKKILPVIILLMLTYCFALPQNVTINKAKLTSAIEQLAVKYKIPDYSVGIIYGDSLCFSINRNKENEGKNYLIGSCSKSLTALAVLKLARYDKIVLDKPIREYLPWFEMKNKSYTDSVTVRRLLNHKSGFERQYGFFDPGVKDAAGYEKKLAEYIKGIKVRFAPGSAFLYSNLNYVLLGIIIRKVTGMAYSDYMAETILPAAGMKNTYFTFSDNNKHNLIKGYQYLVCGIPVKSKLYHYSDFILPAGYISSNMEDLVNYLKFLINNTITSSGDTILTSGLMADLTGGKHQGYAMGWFNTFHDSLRIVRHTGLDENFASSLNIFPGLSLGWVVLCNVNSSEFCDKADLAIQSVLLDKKNPGSASFERPLRWAMFILPLLLLAALIFNVVRWEKAGFRLGFSAKTLPFVRLIVSIVLSVIPLLLVSRMFRIFIPDMIRFSPDIGWGLILIAFFGVAGSLARYFGT